MGRAEQVLADDLELVSRARSKDAEAIQTLILRYQDRVYNTAYRMMGDRGLAEDVAQEVFLKAFKALKKFKGNSSFSTWLYRITVNACTSEWRKASARKRGRELSLSHPNPDGASAGFDPPGGGEDPSASAEREERSRAVHEAIQELEEDFRTVVVLRDIEGFSYEEIADIIDCPLGTVRSRLHRARNDLKEKLKNLL